MSTSWVERATTLALLLSTLPAASASCAHGTYLHRRAEGEAVELPNFDYGTERGPVNWHGIAPENVLCGKGTAQSPINIDSAAATESNGTVSILPAGSITMDVPVQNAVFENLGTNVEVVVNGTSVINGETFTLSQFHFHTPSEHRVDNQYFPAEIHMVHTAEADPTKILVIGLLVQLSADTSTAPLDTIISQVKQIETPGTTVELEALDIAQMTDAVNRVDMFRYEGSLTTPPCSEGVTFHLATHALPLSVAMYNDLKSVVGFNARFIQQPIPAAENILVVAARSLGTLARRSLRARR